MGLGSKHGTTTPPIHRGNQGISVRFQKIGSFMAVWALMVTNMFLLKNKSGVAIHTDLRKFRAWGLGPRNFQPAGFSIEALQIPWMLLSPAYKALCRSGSWCFNA